MRTFKKLVVGIVIIVLIALAFPIINLVEGATPHQGIMALGPDSPELVEVKTILATKCASCHTASPDLPFYSRLPLAGSLIEKDTEMGLRFMNLLEALEGKSPGVPFEAPLAKLEHTVAAGAMPPGRYLALHWNMRLSNAERQALLNWISKTRAETYADESHAPELRTAVVRPVRPQMEADPVKAALGRKLYHDTRLSVDNTLSCASCHDLAKGGTDQAKVSTGVNNQLGPINSPTVFNSVFNLAQFWDGRAADLQEQAAGPVANPLEMGENWDNVIAKLQADAAFVAEFTQVYPEGVSQETVTHAIAEFEKTLITPNAPFDRYLQGEEDALNAQQKSGWAHFQNLGCAMCHVGEAMGGQSFETMGRYRDYFAERGGEKTDADLGRFSVTKNEADRHAFKVPTLRNIALTFPYYHDGTIETLDEAVRLMARHQLGVAITPAQTSDIVAFLQSLTGEYEGASLAAAQ